MIFSLSTYSAFAQSDDSVMIKKISDEILFNGKASSNLYTLCKSVGQRLSGSAGMYKAEQWGLQVLKDAGAENVYLQQCMVPHWVRGKKEFAGYKTKKGKADPVFEVLALGNAVGTGDKGITAQVIEVKNFASNNGYTETLFGRRRYFPNINSRIPFLKNMASGKLACLVRVHVATIDQTVM